MSTVSMVAVGELMVSRGGSVNPLKFPDEEFDLYSIPAFDAGGPEIAMGSAIGSTKQVVQPNDVLLSKIVPHIRRAWVVGAERGRRLIGSGEWIVFRNEQVLPEYLRHVLVGDPFHEQFMQTVSGVGGSLLRARPAFVAGISIPVPPLHEQRRIAAILDQAETLRTQRRAALAQLDSLTQSVFFDMFGEPVTNSKGWKKVPLTDACDSADDIRCGPFGTQLSRAEFKSEGVPLWGIKNVNVGFELAAHEFVDERTAKRLSQYSIEPFDIVMTRKGTVGNCAVYPENFPVGVMHSDLLRLRVSPRLCVSAFLSHQLHYSQDVAWQMSLISGGAVMPGINVSRLKSLLVLLPPLALQQTFATRIQAIAALKATHRAALAELDALFASLQQRAFAGAL